jgi:hypothetical protein
MLCTRFHSFLIIASLTIGGFLIAAPPAGKPKPKRVRPPTFDKSVNDVFARDARKLLVGKRPPLGGTVAPPKTPGKKPTGDPPAASSYAWSKIISRDALETEIKRYNQLVQKNVTTPGKYRSGGYKEGRVQFSTLAIAFGVVAEYDGEPSWRWKKHAPGMRDALAKAGKNSKVGSEAAYKEAKLRKFDLEDMIRGGSVDLVGSPGSVDWSDVTDRSPLMKRLDLAFDKRLKPWLSSPAQFKQNRAAAKHEAEIVAMLAEVMTRKAMDDYEEEDYAEWARTMKQAARTIAEASTYEEASRVAGTISKSCSACHEVYK